MKILFITSNLFGAKLLCSGVEAELHSIVLEESVNKALELLKQDDFDKVIVDAALPACGRSSEMNSWDLIRNIQKQYSDTEIILACDLLFPAVKEACEQHGLGLGLDIIIEIGDPNSLEQLLST